MGQRFSEYNDITNHLRKNMTDTERLDRLNSMAENKWVCMMTPSGRGLRIYEANGFTNDISKYSDIRRAIDAFLREVDHAGS